MVWERRDGCEYPGTNHCTAAGQHQPDLGTHQHWSRITLPSLEHSSSHPAVDFKRMLDNELVWRTGKFNVETEVVAVNGAL